MAGTEGDEIFGHACDRVRTIRVGGRISRTSEMGIRQHRVWAFTRIFRQRADVIPRRLLSRVCTLFD